MPNSFNMCLVYLLIVEEPYYFKIQIVKYVNDFGLKDPFFHII